MAALRPWGWSRSPLWIHSAWVEPGLKPIFCGGGFRGLKAPAPSGRTSNDKSDGDGKSNDNDKSNDNRNRNDNSNSHAGVLRFAQDDGEKQTAATTKAMATAKAT